MRTLVITLLTLLLGLSICNADSIDISRFSSATLAEWESKSFNGVTEYRLINDWHGRSLQADSKGTASGLIRRIGFNPRHYRYLNWSWKVESALDNNREKSKAGDDYAARLYVLFPGFFFWQMKALCYVWSSRLPKEEHFQSPYTGNVIVVVLETGKERAGRWVSEKRDILGDYRRYFGEEPRMAGAVAVMTDTDDTGSTVRSWYGDITISRDP